VAGILEKTLALLDEARQKTDSCLVAFSGGKDSLTVMDLCVRNFKRVEGFFMYLVPGLACQDDRIKEAEDRWGVPIHRVPHWLLDKLLRFGFYSFNHWVENQLPPWKLKDVYELIRADTGIPIIAHGAKRADSRWRKRMLVTWGKDPAMLYPVVDWTKPDVWSYLRARNIPIPDGTTTAATGIDLSTPSLLWLHDHYPADFDTLCRVFPLAEAVVWRRKFYEEHTELEMAS
jgi:phosphoadenosine phosphosulfate reductase